MLVINLDWRVEEMMFVIGLPLLSAVGLGTGYVSPSVFPSVDHRLWVQQQKAAISLCFDRHGASPSTPNFCIPLCLHHTSMLSFPLGADGCCSLPLFSVSSSRGFSVDLVLGRYMALAWPPQPRYFCFSCHSSQISASHVWLAMDRATSCCFSHGGTPEFGISTGSGVQIFFHCWQLCQ